MQKHKSTSPTPLPQMTRALIAVTNKKRNALLASRTLQEQLFKILDMTNVALAIIKNTFFLFSPKITDYNIFVNQKTPKS